MMIKMEHNIEIYGELLATRQFKASASFWFRFGGFVSLGLIVFSGIYLIFDPIEASETPTLGLITLGAAIGLIVFMKLISRKIKREVAIYEEGVVVTKGKKILPFHYNQIAGIYDDSAGGMIVMGGGLVGMVVSGVVSAVASKAIDAIDREFRIRSVDIVPWPDSQLKRTGVVSTGGDILSHVYTEWVIKQKSITKENIESQELHFGDSLKFKNGIFTHERFRGDEVHARLDDVVGVDIQDDKLRLLGTNEAGRQTALISIFSSLALNLDLLLYVVDFLQNSEKAATKAY